MNKKIQNKLERLLNNSELNDQYLLSGIKNILDEEELLASSIKNSSLLGDLITENLNNLSKGINHSNLIKTGIVDFDAKFGGLELGELIVIGGRPAMGKTQLLVHIALAISKIHPILYFTFDLSIFHLSNRFMSAVAEISIDKLLHGNLNIEETIKVTNETIKLKENKIFLNDSCHSSISELRTLCKQHIEQQNVKVIFIDYLQLMSNRKLRQNRDREIATITRELKNIAKDFNVCIIATSQLYRSVEWRGGERKPILSDLRDSGAIEQEADKIIFIYRPEYYEFHLDENGFSTLGITHLNVVKNRTGQVGEILIKRNESITNFVAFDGYKKDL
jgi:replicative DNA helicase